VGSPALKGQSHNPHASTLIGQSQRVSPHASAPTRQPPRVSRLACMAAHVTRIPVQHGFPRSCAACGIRPFDHHHQQPSVAASGSAVRPAKVAICTVSLAGLWKLVAAPDPGQHRRPPSPRPAEPTRLPRRVPARPGSHQTSRSAPPKPRSRKPAAIHRTFHNEYEGI
jgi:hypothetical protein